MTMSKEERQEAQDKFDYVIKPGPELMNKSQTRVYEISLQLNHLIENAENGFSGSLAFRRQLRSVRRALKKLFEETAELGRK